MTCEELIDQVQERLHDDGALWPRTELLDWLNDGYRQLLAQSHACVRPVIFDVPPRVAWAGTQEWEDASAKGTYAAFTRQAQRTRATHNWEAEHLDGITPTNGDIYAVTQLWERSYVASDITRHFRFAIGKEHERPLRVYWDDKALAGASSRELDLRDTEWVTESGEPIMWLKGSGRDRSFELFEIITDYHQPYELRDAEAGLPRHFSGSRSYSVDGGVDRWDFGYTGSADSGVVPGLGVRFTEADDDESGAYYTFDWEDEIDDSSETSSYIASQGWEAEFGADEVFAGIGSPRNIVSADRHYLAAPIDGSDELPVGAPRDFKASTDSVLLFQIIVAPRTLTEDDAPVLVPRQLHKYIRFFVLSRAFARPGEGQRMDLASHYANLFGVGIKIFTALGNPTMLDRVWARENYEPARDSRPPRVRLPSNYPRVF